MSKPKKHRNKIGMQDNHFHITTLHNYSFAFTLAVLTCMYGCYVEVVILHPNLVSVLFRFWHPYILKKMFLLFLWKVTWPISYDLTHLCHMVFDDVTVTAYFNLIGLHDSHMQGCKITYVVVNCRVPRSPCFVFTLFEVKSLFKWFVLNNYIYNIYNYL